MTLVPDMLRPAVAEPQQSVPFQRMRTPIPQLSLRIFPTAFLILFPVRLSTLLDPTHFVAPVVPLS